MGVLYIEVVDMVACDLQCQKCSNAIWSVREDSCSMLRYTGTGNARLLYVQP